MSNDSWVYAVTWLYLGCNATRLVAYVPQARGVLRRDRSEPFAVASWSVLALTNASTVAFALAIHSNVLLIWTATANLLASLLITGLAMKRETPAPQGPRPAFFDVADRNATAPVQPATVCSTSRPNAR